MARVLATLQASQVVLPQIWFPFGFGRFVSIPWSASTSTASLELLGADWSNQDFDPPHSHFSSGRGGLRSLWLRERKETSADSMGWHSHGTQLFGWPDEARFADSTDWLPWQPLRLV